MERKQNKSNWFLESNFVGGAVLGLFFTFFCALGAGGGMEFKDYQWGGEPDVVDFLATCMGGVVGQIFQGLIIYAIWV